MARLSSIPVVFAAASILLSVAARACPALIDGVAADRLEALSRGVNADGWIADPRSAPSRGLLLELRKAGLTHIRLPVPADFVMPRFATQADIDARLQTVDSALKTLLGLGYVVSIDLHSGRYFNALHKDDPQGAMTEMKSAWTALARVIQRYPSDRIFAELLNEPEVDAAQWQGEARELAGFIRQMLPRTTLITGPVNWQRADSLPDFKPLDDPNVVYAVHFYDPMVFTHQAHWDPNEPLHDVVGLPYPARADDPRVQQLREQLTLLNRPRALAMVDRAIPDRGIDKWLEPATAWQRQYSRPIIINEFGVLKAGAPRDSRLRWLAGVTAYARQQCWGWTHWEMSQGFGLADAITGKADQGVLKALLGTR
ncbi:cellulase family glycosylhydrolase [Bradyrhizobium sp. INPA03-11B]|uniref:glycoside hydrolase family 5 protein n=1 Tax=Bradyrhizobium sp. INPA03-11B TaxID=418598 RepID=UPI00338ECCB8